MPPGADHAEAQVPIGLTGRISSALGGETPSSKHQQIGQPLAFMETFDGFCYQGRSRENIHLVLNLAHIEPKRWNAIGDDELFNGGVGDHLLRARHEEAMRHKCDNSFGAGFAYRARCPLQRVSCADQVVYDK